MNSNMTNTELVDKRARQMKIIHVISDVTRIQIMQTLAENGELCARDVLQLFQITQPTLSHHMSVLHSSGLVHSKKSGRWVFYSISRDGIMEIAEYFESLLSYQSDTKDIEGKRIVSVKKNKVSLKKTPMLPVPKSVIPSSVVVEEQEDKKSKGKKKDKTKDIRKGKKKKKKK
jgi:ArsR family transcriptional regulator